MNLLQAPTLPRGVYALCDDTVRPDLPLLEKARLLLEGGVGVIQLRMKRTPVREALDAATAIAALCRARGALCVVNDRVDLAWLSGAHGVHLGDEDLPVAEARRLLGPGALVGRHRPERERREGRGGGRGELRRAWVRCSRRRPSR